MSRSEVLLFLSGALTACVLVVPQTVFAQTSHTFLPNVIQNGYCWTPTHIVPGSPEVIYALAVTATGIGRCETNASGEMSHRADRQTPVKFFRLTSLSAENVFDSTSFTILNNTGAPLSITTTANDAIFCDGTQVGSPQSDVIPAGSQTVAFSRTNVRCIDIVFDTPGQANVALTGFSLGALPVELMSFSVE